MVKPEFTGKRDLTYNLWHRTVGDQYYMLDVDCLEWRNGRGIVAIIERGLYNSESNYSKEAIIRFKRFELKVVTELSQKLKVPAYLTFYNIELSEFDVYQIQSEQALHFKKMNVEEYSNFIRNL